MDGELCPDGSYVSRTGPSCEFAECPKFTISSIDTSAWKTVSDSTTGVTFKYPQDLNTTYINASDWPPQVQVLSGPFACVDAGEPNARSGQTLAKTINGHNYCITIVSEGAAGSTYLQYAYETTMQDKNLYFTFTLREPQCANYDDPQKTTCETERKSFDVDNLIDNIIQTTTIL